MSSQINDRKSLEPAATALARLGPAHGYRLNGDAVSLHSMFAVEQTAAHDRSWALQLWACPTAPANPLQIHGHLVTEVPLPPIGEIADDTETFAVTGFASTPAGARDFFMVLALAARVEGRYVEIHDFAIYPRRESFIQPRLTGRSAYRQEGQRVTLEVEAIENPRPSSNLSGTLALELWALSEPYQGGAFAGVPLAGVATDSLSGQSTVLGCSFNLPFTPPPAGNWNVVLMLREWTAAGYQTRDFVNFSQPITTTTQPVIASPAPSTTAPATTATPAPAATPATPTIASRPNLKPNPSASTASTNTPSAKPTSSSPTKNPGTVSVNSATAEELATVEGLPAKVAQAIVSKRPFKSLDDLAKIKGMGARLLAKVRSSLRL